MDVVGWLRSFVGGPTVKSDRALFGARAHLRSENFFRASIAVSGHLGPVSRCLLRVDAVEKVFLGDRTNFSRGADAMVRK